MRGCFAHINNLLLFCASKLTALTICKTEAIKSPEEDLLTGMRRGFVQELFIADLNCNVIEMNKDWSTVGCSP